MFGETPISLCSNKEPVLALSSCDVKYITASLSVCAKLYGYESIEGVVE